MSELDSAFTLAIFQKIGKDEESEQFHRELGDAIVHAFESSERWLAIWSIPGETARYMGPFESKEAAICSMHTFASGLKGERITYVTMHDVRAFEERMGRFDEEHRQRQNYRRAMKSVSTL